MNDRKIILITGVADYWGARLTQQLLSNPDYHLIGLDSKPPKEIINGLDFIQADIRNPLLAELLRTEAVDAVCHLTFLETTRPSEAAFDINVIGTMNLLGACAEAGVRKVVLKSGTEVYGALSSNPAFITEGHSLNGYQTYGYTRYLVEIEAFCSGFHRQCPDLQLTILRFANIVGPTVSTPMTRFLREPFAPTLLGFDPMLQIIHEDDVLGALEYAIENNVRGVFNVASEGVIPLTKLLGIVRKIPLPLFHSCAYKGAELLGRGSFPASKYVPIDFDYLRYPWVGDLTRMREEMGFAPRFTLEQTLREFAAKTRIGGYVHEAVSLAQDEENLRDTIERRKRSRSQRESRQGNKIQEVDGDE